MNVLYGIPTNILPGVWAGAKTDQAQMLAWQVIPSCLVKPSANRAQLHRHMYWCMLQTTYLDSGVGKSKGKTKKQHKIPY